jgi:hypothetical protein
MKIFINKLFKMSKMSLAIFCASFWLVSSNLHADSCASRVTHLIKHDPVYHALYKALRPQIKDLTSLLQNAQDQTSYQALLDFCNNLATVFPTGRIVIVDSDGLVAVDTSKGSLNTYANYQAGANPATFASAINVNHNSRIAILDAQLYRCGRGAETKFSNSVQVNQNYVALRLGPYLNSVGTARISVNEGTLP